MSCERLATCIFFNDQMATIPLAADLYKATFCKGDFSACARYLVLDALGPEGVPADLFPNEAERAHEILKCAKL